VTTRFNSGDSRGVPSGYEGNASPEDVRVPSCGLEDLDKAFFKVLRDGVAFQIGNDPSKQQRVPIVFAVGEKWSMLKSGRALRDKNKTLILPLVTVRRVGIEQGKEDITGRGMNQQVGQYTVRTKLDPRDRAYQNILNKLALPNSVDAPGEREFDEEGSLTTTRDGTQANANDADVRSGGLLAPKLGVNVWQIVTLPTPQFYTATFELTIWAQYTQHMNQMLERLMVSFLPTGRRTLRLETDKGYWFVAYFDEGYSSEDNADSSTGEELIRKYKLTVKVPGYIVESNSPGTPSGVRKFVSAPQISFVTGGEQTDTFFSNGIPADSDPYAAADDPDREYLLNDPSQHPQNRVDQLVERVVVNTVVNPFTGRREPEYARVISRNTSTGESVLVPDDGIGLRILSSR